MLTLPQLSRAVREALRQLTSTRDQAREVVCTARLAIESAHETRYQSQELRRALREQGRRARALRQQAP